MILSFCVLIVTLILFSIGSSNITLERERFFDGMANQKLYIVYTNGHAITMELKKNYQLRVTRKKKLEYDICSYYGYYDNQNINVFAGSRKNIERQFSEVSDMKILQQAMPNSFDKCTNGYCVPFNFEVDSSYVVTNEYFWIIGNYLILGLIEGQNSSFG